MVNCIAGRGAGVVRSYRCNLGSRPALRASETKLSSRILRTDLSSPPPSSKGASLVAQLVKNPPTMQETQFRSLGWEDPLEKEMATHSSIVAWRISWTVACQAPLSVESQEPDTP